MDQQAAAGISKSDPRPGTAGGLSPVLGVGLFVLLAAIVAGYYALLLTSGHFDLFHPVPRGMVFNSMMEHMLQGRFDVDPDAVGYEAFLRDGRTYAYWGVFCALLRLPLMFAPGWRTVDVTVLSSLIAILLAVWFKLRALYFLLQRAPDGAGTRFLGILVGLAILFSGAQISFMRLSLYQEVCFWGAAFGAGFMLAALRGLLEDRFPLSRLCWMALLAGLALNTRVTCGINLYGALGLLVAALAFRSQPSSARLRLIAPLAVLGLFAVLTGVVNYGRWGNPFTFANYYIYALNLEPAHADNLARMDKYGLFSLERIPYGLIYYFFSDLGAAIRPGALPATGAAEEAVRLLRAAAVPLRPDRPAAGRAVRLVSLAARARSRPCRVPARDDSGADRADDRLHHAPEPPSDVLPLPNGFLPAAGARRVPWAERGASGIWRDPARARAADRPGVGRGVRRDLFAWNHGGLQGYPGRRGLGRVPPRRRPRLSRPPAGRDAVAAESLRVRPEKI